MAKISNVKTGSQTPAEQAVAHAAQEFTVTDEAGKTITIRRPGPLAQFRLMEAVGGTNRGYINMCMPLIFVAAINGDGVSPLRTKAEVEALVTRLDEAGLVALSKAVEEHFGEQTPEEDAETIKK